MSDEGNTGKTLLRELLPARVLSYRVTEEDKTNEEKDLDLFLLSCPFWKSEGVTEA